MALGGANAEQAKRSLHCWGPTCRQRPEAGVPVEGELRRACAGRWILGNSAAPVDYRQEKQKNAKVGGFWETRAAPVDYQQEKQKNAKRDFFGCKACEEEVNVFLITNSIIRLEEEWQKELVEGMVLQLIEMISGGWCSKNECDDDLKGYWQMKDDLVVDEREQTGTSQQFEEEIGGRCAC
ncbi:hypothetical protein NDU88_005664 [Pleurodeles waltl]|uniref:Uncharacterized protein n=1 Tax=Pleurodeles waltl TaxID=8319 RepID=A0AAV7VJM2_PLEWA|nr:hypothetical protein NDU88_005664 [Pleurodeles waltl]